MNGPFLRSSNNIRIQFMMAKIADVPNMSPKRGNNQFYKGKGSTSEGRITSRGRFIQDPSRMKYILAPSADISSFALKPYVSRLTPTGSKLASASDVTKSKA